MERNMIIISSRKFYRGGGIPVSTENLFKGQFEIVLIENFSQEELIEICSSYKEVLFSGYDVSEETILRTLKQRGKKIFVFWHFGMAILTGEPKHIANWISLVKFVKEGCIDLVLTCKAGFDKMWKAIPTLKGTPILHIRNNVTDSSYRNVPKTHMAGVYSGSGDTWVKNSFCNLTAVAMHGGKMSVDITPLSLPLKEYGESLGLNVVGVDMLAHDEFLKRMSFCEYVLYVTMTEGCPMLPMEALMNGVLCLTGNNHDIFSSSPFLESVLVVSRADDPLAIARQLDTALNHKKEIFEEFAECKETWDILCKRDMDLFLNYKVE